MEFRNFKLKRKWNESKQKWKKDRILNRPEEENNAKELLLENSGLICLDIDNYTEGDRETREKELINVLNEMNIKKFYLNYSMSGGFHVILKNTGNIKRAFTDYPIYKDYKADILTKDVIIETPFNDDGKIWNDKYNPNKIKLKSLDGYNMNTRPDADFIKKNDDDDDSTISADSFNDDDDDDDDEPPVVEVRKTRAKPAPKKTKKEKKNKPPPVLNFPYDIQEYKDLLDRSGIDFKNHTEWLNLGVWIHHHVNTTDNGLNLWYEVRHITAPRKADFKEYETEWKSERMLDYTIPHGKWWIYKNIFKKIPEFPPYLTYPIMKFRNSLNDENGFKKQLIFNFDRFLTDLNSALCLICDNACDVMYLDDAHDKYATVKLMNPNHVWNTTLFKFKYGVQNLCYAFLMADEFIGRLLHFRSDVQFMPPYLQYEEPILYSQSLNSFTYIKGDINPITDEKDYDYEKIRFLVDHIKESTCGGDEQAFQWFKRYCYGLVVDKKPTDIMCVIHGQGGSGKSAIGAFIRKQLIGHKYSKTGESNILTSNFNSVFEQCLFIHLDEGGDEIKKEKFKTKITERDVQYEAKGKDRKDGKQHFSIMWALNNIDPLISKSGCDDAFNRRFNILKSKKLHDVNTKEGKAYYTKLWNYADGTTGLGNVSGTFIKWIRDTTDLSIPLTTILDNDIRDSIKEQSLVPYRQFLKDLQENLEEKRYDDVKLLFRSVAKKDNDRVHKTLCIMDKINHHSYYYDKMIDYLKETEEKDKPRLFPSNWIILMYSNWCELNDRVKYKGDLNRKMKECGAYLGKKERFYLLKTRISRDKTYYVGFNLHNLNYLTPYDG